jgi:serine/threonine protein kinase
VLELTQESKCTIFLLMELANGGELFDRIKIDCGTREETATLFFQQLLSGVKHCHEQGVCHRDLKPEVIKSIKQLHHLIFFDMKYYFVFFACQNLLLQDTVGAGTVLKVG